MFVYYYIYVLNREGKSTIMHRGRRNKGQAKKKVISYPRVFLYRAKLMSSKRRLKDLYSILMEGAGLKDRR